MKKILDSDTEHLTVEQMSTFALLYRLWRNGHRNSNELLGQCMSDLGGQDYIWTGAEWVGSQEHPELHAGYACMELGTFFTSLGKRHMELEEYLQSKTDAHFFVFQTEYYASVDMDGILLSVSQERALRPEEGVNLDNWTVLENESESGEY